MVLPTPFTTSSPTIATYDFTEIAEATGFVTFYGSQSIDDTTKTHFLSSNKTNSQFIVTKAALSTESFSKVIDLDFDVLFNLPQTVRGTARANITVGGGNLGSANTVGQAYAVIRLRHWDGTTETEVAEAQTHKIEWASNANYSEIMNVALDATASQHYKKGDTLRMTVEIWGKVGSGANGSDCGFGHDPNERIDPGLTEAIPPVADTQGQVVTDANTTQLSFLIPFRLEV